MACSCTATVLTDLGTPAVTAGVGVGVVIDGREVVVAEGELRGSAGRGRFLAR